MTSERWYYREGYSPAYHGHVINENTGATIAVTYDDKDAAKARLAAAAPDFLRVCEALTAACRMFPDVKAAVGTLYREIDEVIVKATLP
jgi:hypothetical protein